MPGWSATIVLVATRVAALAIIVPGMQNRFVPWRLRMLLVALMTLPVLCVIPPYSEDVVEPSQLFGLLIQEASIGLSLAVVPAALFLGLQLATESLQGMTGLPGGAGDSETSGDGLSRFFYIVALTVFFGISGHRLVVQSVLDSFHWMPVGSVSSLPTTKDIVLDVFAQSFEFGVRAMTPVAASLAVGVLVLAAINRVIPQLGYFAIGMSVQNTVLLASLVIFLGGIGLYLESGFEVSTDAWQSEWLAVMHRIKTP